MNNKYFKELETYQKTKTKKLKEINKKQKLLKEICVLTSLLTIMTPVLIAELLGGSRLLNNPQMIDYLVIISIFCIFKLNYDSLKKKLILKKEKEEELIEEKEISFLNDIKKIANNEKQRKELYDLKELYPLTNKKVEMYIEANELYEKKRKNKLTKKKEISIK